MRNHRTYVADADELRPIDEAMAQEPIPEAELPRYYRREAERLRRRANTAETIEMRITLLGAARRAEYLAELFSR